MKQFESAGNIMQWLKISGIALLLFVAFQSAIGIGQSLGTYISVHRAVDQIERRVSLDSAYLDVGNKLLGTPVDRGEVARYIQRLNQAIKKAGYPVQVASLQGVKAVYEETVPNHSISTITMETAEQQLKLRIATAPWWHAPSFSVLALIATIAVTPVIIRIRQNKKRRIATEQEDIANIIVPHLVIDLTRKTIRNGVDEREATMQNKPFCFYVALVKYCIEHPDTKLLHHSDIPQELTTMANGVFSRLIELGHTKRKRPDFNANLDKTLSEIRSTLEDVFAPFADAKDKFYPPRAQGEGSRSKQHSFALTNISLQDIEIIGN